MARYLDKQALQAKLNFGKEVEVFLGRDNEDKNIISFLVLRKQNEKIGIYHYQCFDEGGLDYLDIYSFSEVEEKDTYQVLELDSIEDAVEFIKTQYSLVEVRFVNQGVSQEEYKDLLQSEGVS
ncbi:hypothetical protein [Spirosoma sp. KNUC1025]|uniref:hypothetical protein n=1 Tax=Spirosoma sp. KNUC1025 TaxID=2894082 RepID=UPI00386E10A7|nr:hypothetical protein LN737_17225 [Spirosoma sp. KNUC1025]